MAIGTPVHEERTFDDFTIERLWCIKGLTKSGVTVKLWFMPKQKKTQSRQKTLYRVKNWSEYGKALVQRGSITFWLSDDFEKDWQYIGKK